MSTNPKPIEQYSGMKCYTFQLFAINVEHRLRNLARCKPVARSRIWEKLEKYEKKFTQNLRKVQAEGPGKVWSGGLPGAELTVVLESARGWTSPSHAPVIELPKMVFNGCTFSLAPTDRWLAWYIFIAPPVVERITVYWGQKGAHFPQNKDFIYAPELATWYAGHLVCWPPRHLGKLAPGHFSWAPGCLGWAHLVTGHIYLHFSLAARQQSVVDF